MNSSDSAGPRAASADRARDVTPEAVIEVLLAGLRAYSVQATADVRLIDEGTWFISIDAEPDGLDLEVTVRASAFRLHTASGTIEDATLGDALNYAALAAGAIPVRRRRRRRRRVQVQPQCRSRPVEHDQNELGWLSAPAPSCAMRLATALNGPRLRLCSGAATPPSASCSAARRQW